MALVNLNAREKGIRAAFQESVRSHPQLQQHTATCEKILEFYHIKDSTSDQDALLRIISFVTDIMFYAPSVALSQTWEKSYLCHFNEGNPWPGLYQDRANHMLDIAYLWQNFNHTLAEPQKAVARVFADHIISFTAGQEVVPSFMPDQRVTVYGPSSQGFSSCFGHMEDEGITARRTALFRLAEEAGGMDVLLNVVSRFLMG